MAVRHDTDGSLLGAVMASPRALVLLTVPWSVPERHARLAHRAAAERLAADHPALGVECYAMDEEGEWCQAWLGALGVEGVGGGVPRGAGSLLWLEGGRLVSCEVGGCSLQTADIVSRSLSLWADPKGL